MQNLKKLISMILLLAMVFVVACNKDDEELSPADAKAGLEALNTDMSFYLDEMQDAEGILAMEALMGLPVDPFGSTKSNVHSPVLLNMQKLLVPANYERTKIALETGLFDFDGNVGTYTWNSTAQDWDVAHGGTTIIINFPSEETGTTNDATITIYSYDEVAITDEEYTDYYPTELTADLTVNDIEYVNIDFAATWKTDGEPESITVTVYLNPFTFGGSFNNLGTSANANFEIEYEETLIFAVGAGATFESSDWDNPPLNINGYIQLLNVKIQANANFKNIVAIIESVDNGTSDATDFEELFAQINAEFDAYVSVDGTKAADIVLVWDDTATDFDPENMIMFEFSDGSLEPAMPYFEDFATDLEEFFGFFEEIFDDGSM
jgi:hypothetical protein